MSQALVKLDAARKALAEARSVQEVKEIRDKAKAIADYLKRAEGGLEAANDALEIKLWSEWRIGELLEELPRESGKRTDKATSSHDVTRLQETEIPPMQQVRYRRVHRLSEPEVAAYITETREQKKEITTAGALRLLPTEREPEPFSPTREAEAIYKWLEARRLEWPEKYRNSFFGVLRNVAEQLEDVCDAERRQGMDDSSSRAS